jgi:cell division protein FtsI (penicillin-binding protein 3)
MKLKNLNIEHRSLIVYIFFIVILAIAVVAKLIHIQYVKGNDYRELAKKTTVKEFVVKANRGNIYAEDGSALATSEPKYDVAFDPTVPSQDIFDAQVEQLAGAISRFSGKSKSELMEKFINARKKNRKYVRVLRNLIYSDYVKVKDFPIFKLGQRKGGFIAELHTVRAYPLGGIMRRTVGYDKGKGNRVGIEGAFTDILSGKDGLQKKQKIKYGVWKPLNDFSDVEPKDGYDIITNINVDFQDVAHHALLNQLVKYEADHGSVVVMEVETGAVKAIVNLGKNSKGNYDELRNYTVYETHEPGSTFKLFSIMALLEDKMVDTSKVVNTGNGIYKIYDKNVRDAHHGGMGKLTLKQVFEKSSNVGVVKMVYENYRSNPQKFVNRLYNFGLHEKVGIDIKGEGKPVIPDPNDKNWSGISLPWMAYGYGVELTDLQILTYYNAIANNGKVMQPYLVSQVKSYDKVIKTFEPETLNTSIASIQTVKTMQEMMRGVVRRGTATNIRSNYVALAGKTGTAQTEYWKGKGQYISSFVGYFPADKPKYSMIVVIHKPNAELGYYGNIVAAPVFKKVAEYIYGKMPVERKVVIDEVKTSDRAESILAKYKTIMPDLRGLSSKEALYILENLGLTVRLKGSGTVKKQSIPRGEKIKKNQIVELKLS